MVKTQTSFMHLLMSAVFLPHLTAPVACSYYSQLVIRTSAESGSGTCENE